MASAMASCELINPDETIPAFLKIDSISLSTTLADEGHPDHNITDAWVYDNDKLVGIFELPAVVPIVRNGLSSIRIRAGIKLNGLVGTRIPLLFTKDYQADLELFPDSALQVNPTLTFRDDATFAWLEDFDAIGLSITTSTNSNASVERINNDEAFDGNSLKMALNASQNIFECQRISPLVLPGGGVPVIMDFTYRCNHPFVVGLYSTYPGGSVQVPIIVLNPSEDWNHIYVNLTDAISANPNYDGHRPFFGFLRGDGFEGEIKVYLDNIRLLH